MTATSKSRLPASAPYAPKRRFGETRHHEEPTVVGGSPQTGGLFFGYLLLIFIVYTGVDNDLRFLKVVRFTTLLAYGLFVLAMFRGALEGVLSKTQTKLFLGFVVLTVLSVSWAVVQRRAFDAIQPWCDATVLFLLTCGLVDRPKRIVQLGLTLLSAITLLVARNFGRLGEEARIGSFRAPYFLGDGNDLAWGLVVVMPIILYLFMGTRAPLMRLLGASGTALCIIGIVGTGSRGGAIGLLSALLVYWLTMTRRRIAGVIGIAVVLTGIVVIAPADYWTRLESLTAYEQDNSAQARLQAWGVAIQMAIDNPLGVGADNFASAYGRYYLPELEQNAIQWGSQRWISAHSVYFKSLGEYGVLGLVLLIWMIKACIADNIVARRQLLSLHNRSPVPAVLPGLLVMSLVGYGVCGVFLGGLTYPHIFLLAGLTISVKRWANDQVTGPKS